MESRKYDYSILEDRLGYRFERADLLVLALTHPSWNQDRPQETILSNQRLEFLGDSVLNLVISEFLFQQYPEHPEGILTRYRSALVKGKLLYRVAEEIGLEPFIRLGKSEQANARRGRQSRMEDALEAVLGAVYLDGGIEAARSVVKHLIGDLNLRLTPAMSEDNAKGRLQEWIQQKGWTTGDIEYRMVSATGPDHLREFSVSLFFQGREIGSGTATSRKEAETLAARQGLEALILEER